MTPRESRWIEQLKTIVHYRDQRRLDLWEEACCREEPYPLESTTDELLVEVQMLGRCNLYQAFQPERTRAYYERLIPFFAERGVQIPPAPDLSAW
ncbi:MAG: hypothetical protein JNG89_17575 [Planctomycetaceae bacterium]|nr:hypothetical protein [Planctomycetaceae bacterium]